MKQNIKMLYSQSIVKIFSISCLYTYVGVDIRTGSILLIKLNVTLTLKHKNDLDLKKYLKKKCV
jgi:hypothetical protein